MHISRRALDARNARRNAAFAAKHAHIRVDFPNMPVWHNFDVLLKRFVPVARARMPMIQIKSS